MFQKSNATSRIVIFSLMPDELEPVAGSIGNIRLMHSVTKKSNSILEPNSPSSNPSPLSAVTGGYLSVIYVLINATLVMEIPTAYIYTVEIPITIPPRFTRSKLLRFV